VNPQSTTASLAAVREIRRFNRFYTRQIGLLQAGLLSSPFSLTEVRVLYELAHQNKLTAGDLCRELGLDAGYLSRLLANFVARRLVKRERSANDGRQSFLHLTRQGREVFAPLEARSDAQVAAMLDRLPDTEQKELIAAMRTIEEHLGKQQQANTDRPAYILRMHQPGDMGWVVERHGVLYWQEYRYDERFEALVAEIVAQFIQNFDPRRERCWIAERGGKNVGSIFLVRKSETVCKLRLLLVEPSARGLGIGRRLVEECVRFGRQAGYRKMMLWTQTELAAARYLYRQAGFNLTAKEPHQSWGREDLVSETWELKL
jgi:DNA-binding MarR family transcriptional regulator/N-acetylglutamate synthase-like GNAT family acetyltransferase